METGDLFIQFWERYPRKKEGKKRACNKFRALLKQGHQAEEIMRALEAYIRILSKEGREVKYVKHAVTFLNNYEDYLGNEDDEPPPSANLSLAQRVLAGEV